MNDTEPSNLLTQIEYATMRGCSQQYISKLIGKGRITLVDGKIDPKQADRQIKQSSDLTHPKNRSHDDEATLKFKKAQFRNLMADTKLKQLENEILDGKWVPRKTVEKHAFESGRMMRDAILRLADRHETSYNNPKTRAKAVKRIRAELRDIVEGSRQRSIQFLKREAGKLANQEVIEDDD